MLLSMGICELFQFPLPSSYPCSRIVLVRQPQEIGFSDHWRYSAVRPVFTAMAVARLSLATVIPSLRVDSPVPTVLVAATLGILAQAQCSASLARTGASAVPVLIMMALGARTSTLVIATRRSLTMSATMRPAVVKVG